VTTVPVFTVREEGSNAKFFIDMEFPPPVEAGGAAGVTGADGVWGEEQPAAILAKIKRTKHAE
jgi:hypothetical protein